MPRPKAPQGRPTDYTEELAATICNGLAEGHSLMSVLRDLQIPASTVFNWLHANPMFMENYTRARTTQADVLVEQILEIIDDKHDDPNSRRVRMDGRKWIAGKLRPKKYGEASQVDINLGGQRENPVELELKLSPSEAYKRMLGGDQ